MVTKYLMVQLSGVYIFFYYCRYIILLPFGVYIFLSLPLYFTTTLKIMVYSGTIPSKYVLLQIISYSYVIDHICSLGTGLELACDRGSCGGIIIIKKRLMSFAFEKTARVSLSCTLVPVQYREYEEGL